MFTLTVHFLEEISCCILIMEWYSVACFIANIERKKSERKGMNPEMISMPTLKAENSPMIWKASEF